jgi:hypothetical protein
VADAEVLAWGISFVLICGGAAFLYAKADSERRLRDRRESIDQAVDAEVKRASLVLDLHHQHLERMARVEAVVDETRSAVLREKLRRLQRARRRGAARLTGRPLAGRRR